jgi:hypothetical protein
MIKATAIGHLERIALGYFENIVCWREGCGKAPPCPDCPHFRTPSRAPVALAPSGNDQAPATELLSAE